MKLKIHALFVMASLSAFAGTGQVNSGGNKSIDSGSIKKTVGYYVLNANQEGRCDVALSVHFISPKKSNLGKECGNVLWASSPGDPMGIFFCKADTAYTENNVAARISNGDVEGKILVNFSGSGLITSNSVRNVVLASNNDKDLFSGNDNIKKTEDTLTLTKIGIDLESKVTFENGTSATNVCNYRKATLKEFKKIYPTGY